MIGYPPHYKGKRDVVIVGNSTYDAGAGVGVSQQYYPQSQYQHGMPFKQSQHQHVMHPQYFQQSQYQHAVPFQPMPQPMFTPDQQQQLLKILN